eukprot:GFUD01040424.1.p1 GENE.GFUD01040424.1~~GFUD01040424.1.p1  ORF type:complete len:329 (+),score=97.53 GFUD01040424.1:162-1148(+)
MVSSEKFCLRWNDFESNISVAFREIREEKDFFDCTLSCGSRQIQAHKLILSACSPFFKSIIRQNPHQHPLLYLKGVQFTDMQAVLNFMYHGEVNVAQEELNSFLSIAEDLQVKGLTQNNSSRSTPKSKPEPATTAPAHRPRQPKEPEPTPPLKRPLGPPSSQQLAYQAQTETNEEVLPMPVVKTEPQVAPLNRGEGTMGMEMTSMEENYVEEGYEDYGGYDGQEYYEGGDGGGYEEYGEARSTEENKGQPSSPDTINEQILEDPHGLGFTCALCGKGFGLNKRHCRRHIKNFHNQTGAVLACDICQKCYKNKDSLRHHQRTTHGLYKQ